ncbi:MAG: YraN family protein [Polyangiaceae bacterium]
MSDGARPRHPRERAAPAAPLPSPRSPQEKPPITASQRARAAARDLGIRAEHAAQEHLLANGFEIFGANVRAGRFEIDLIARDHEVLVIVEVRARGPGSLIKALDTIDARKQRRLRAAAGMLWRNRFARDKRIERVRFDCVAVTFDEAGDARVEHVKAAF